MNTFSKGKGSSVTLSAEGSCGLRSGAKCGWRNAHNYGRPM